jgi:hypothetical protein
LSPGSTTQRLDLVKRGAVDRTDLPRGRGDRIRDAIDVAEGSEITRVRATPRRALLLVFVIEVPSVHRDRFVVRSLPLRNSTGLRCLPGLLRDPRAWEDRRFYSPHAVSWSDQLVGLVFARTPRETEVARGWRFVIVRRSPAVTSPCFRGESQSLLDRERERQRRLLRPRSTRVCVLQRILQLQYLKLSFAERYAAFPLRTQNSII